MNSKQMAVILKSFEAPDEVRMMQKGKFELVPSRRDDNRSRDL